MVARLLWEQDVAGSNPVIPTIKAKTTARFVLAFMLFGMKRFEFYHLETKASVCFG